MQKPGSGIICNKSDGGLVVHGHKSSISADLV